MNHLTIAVVALLTAGCALAGPAGAATPPADYSLDFSATAPGTGTDAALHILYRDPENPDDPDGKMPPLTRVAIKAPAGTVFDPTAVPVCDAGDGELQMQGRAACPADTVVGTGFGTVTGTDPSSGPFVLDATLINAGDAVIELFTFPGTDATAAIDRAKFENPSTMVLHPAVVPGITEREFSWTYLGSPPAATKPFITTPRRCPRVGAWQSGLDYTVTTGASYSVSDTTPCARPKIAVELEPGRVRAGERVPVDVRLSSGDEACISRAKVRLGGDVVRTDDRGRATIQTAYRKPGRHRVTASKRGCERGSAVLEVR